MARRSLRAGSESVDSGVGAVVVVVVAASAVALSSSGVSDEGEMGIMGVGMISGARSVKVTRFLMGLDLDEARCALPRVGVECFGEEVVEW